MWRNQRGMTLLEIMIVLAILGGLIAVLAGQVNKQRQKAQVQQAKVIMAELSKALDMYYTDCGSYPSTSEGLEALMQNPGTCPSWGPDSYMKKIPRDPWNNPFVYESKGGSFVIISLGADRKEGGTGYDADISSED